MRIILLYILALIICLSSFKGFAIEIGSSDSKLDITGNINVAGFQGIDSNQVSAFAANNDYMSNIRFAFSSTMLQGLKASAVVDLGIQQPQESKTNNMFEGRYLFLQLEEDNMGVLQLGKTDSQVNILTVASTNKAFINKLDAGYTFTNVLEEFGDKDGGDFSTQRISQAIVYSKVIDSVSVGFQFQGKEQNVTARNNQEQQTILNPNNPFTRRYAVGGSIKYQGEVLGLGLGYQRVGNTLSGKYYSSSQENARITSNMIDSDSFLASTSLQLSSFYMAVSGGYYKNLKIAGVTHMGASAVMQYQLTKVMPYVGYQLLYADDIHSTIHSAGSDIYNVQGNPNYSLDQSYFVAGMAYNATKVLSIGIEYMGDLRTKHQADTSMLNNQLENVTMVYLKYKVI